MRITKGKNGRAVEAAIMKDIKNLKESASSVAHHLQDRSMHKLAEMQDGFMDGMETIQKRGMEGVEAIDDQIKENPRRSVLFAFVAGLAVNSLLRRAE